MKGIMYNNYLFGPPLRSGQKILKMNTLKKLLIKEMTLTFWVNPIQKQKQPQNAENDQNGLKRDMLVNFAK